MAATTPTSTRQLEPINIDFQFISTGDPKVMIILDTSTWGIIENKPAIIEIVPPNKTKALVYSYQKLKTNVFNSSNLFLSPIGCFEDMPDGVYQIIVKGSPDTNCKQRDILKTDQFDKELDTLYIAIGFSNGKEKNENRETLLEIDSLMHTAKAFMRQGKSYEALTYFKKAMLQLSKYIKCNQD